MNGLQTAALTDVGMRRATNQDSHALLLAETPEMFATRGHLLMVADGMGAHAAGELASKLAADGVPHLYHKYREFSAPEALQRAIRETNTEINRRGTASADFHNMGTTSSVLVLLPQGALAAHVGDSRIYRLRGGTLSQLTFDHSLQWELQASGQLPAGTDIAAVVPKNVITRSLGPNINVQVDLEGPHPIAPGDIYMLCSDGLTGRVEDAEIGAILSCLPPQEAAQSLVDLANLRGGPDNVTVLVARIASKDLATGATHAEPLRIGASSERPAAHPATWIIGAVCLLIGIVLALTGRLIPAAVAVGIGAVAGLVGLVQRFGVAGGTVLGNGHMLGRGPYTSVACPPSHELALKLAATLDELRSAAREGNWDINWKPLDDACRQAQSADQAGNFADAVRHYCRGISYMMKQLRLQNVRHGDNSVHD
ncbi:MAG TPA: protein phosphatase 2C domain-containing protein [Pirellulaceae bacterium]|nr:protein phosphatase 2C domain-containing protein [Pirellulaceae bacterium]